MITKQDIDKDYSNLNAFERRKVFTLARRAEHLASRICLAPKGQMDFDKMELSAIRWVLDFVRETL